MIISLSYGISSLPGKVSNVFTLNIRTILLFTVPTLKINLHILLTSIVSRQSECRPWSNCLDFNLGLHCLLRLYYVGIFRVNMVVYFKELDMVKTYVLVHLCIKQSLFAQSKWCTNWFKAEMLISWMSHRSPPVGCYETPLLSYTAQTPCVLWQFVTLCGLSLLFTNLMLLYVGLVFHYLTLLLSYMNWPLRFVHLSIRYVGLFFTNAGLILKYLVCSLRFVHFLIPSVDISFLYVTMASWCRICREGTFTSTLCFCYLFFYHHTLYKAIYNKTVSNKEKKKKKKKKKNKQTNKKQMRNTFAEYSRVI